MQYDQEDSEGTPDYKGKKTTFNRVKKQQDKKEFKPPKKISERYLYNSGLAYLQRFPASSYHFKTVMMHKIDKSCRYHTAQDRETCEKWLDALVSQFQELGLLDDKAYLKGMVTTYRRRGLSTMQIKLKLGQKGYTADDIQKQIKNYDRDEFDSDKNGELYAALTFARKKRLGPYDIDERKTFDKALGAMARAGYSFDIAKKVLELSHDELEELRPL